MERLTTNKDASEMNMVELAHNSCYIKDGFARYRDFDGDVDARELVTLLVKKYVGIDVPKNVEALDEYIMDCLQYSVYSIEGLVALFYRNLWAMAELREKLRDYEDAEENGLLVRLPCKIGDTVFCVFDVLKIIREKPFEYSDIDEIGKTVFLTQAEAEAKLKEMESENGD